MVCFNVNVFLKQMTFACSFTPAALHNAQCIHPNETQQET